MKSRGREKIYHVLINKKKAGVAISISDKGTSGQSKLPETERNISDKSVNLPRKCGSPKCVFIKQ